MPCSHSATTSIVNGEATGSAVECAGKPADPAVSSPMEYDDGLYFASYSDLQCHQTMVFDHSRTSAYRKAIFALAKDKIVLEVGCGTGILSVFAAQAGASHVFAVEASAPMAAVAQRIVAENGLEEKITVLTGKVEDIDHNVVNDGQKVDLIISEWMGYGLFTEWMLDSVLYARDTYLSDRGGIMLPSKARVYLAPVTECTYLKNHSNTWLEAEKMFKVNMSCLQKDERQTVLGRIVVHDVPPWETIAKSCKILDLDLASAGAKDYEFGLRGNFNFAMYGSDQCYGFALWFDVDLAPGVVLSTSPFTKEQTHWCQMVIYLKEPVQVEQDTQTTGEIEFLRQPGRSVALKIKGKIGDTIVDQLFSEYVDF